MLRFRSSASQANRPQAGSSPDGPDRHHLERVPTDGSKSLLRTHAVLAIVRFHEPADLDGTLGSLIAGGIRLLEVTLDTPGALDAIERAAGSDTTIGAGTVLTSDEVHACADRGARFVVSPGLRHEVVEAALDRSIVPLPGVLTPTEILSARSLGLDAVKVFPASLGGPSYLRTLRGPFPTTTFVPTGGIELDEVSLYLDAGAACVGLGSSLVGSRPPRSPADLEALTSRARQAVAVAGVATAEIEGTS
jgi:2-dehydro-3-deoxyphosphogluconate aldolase / (4S)-4-hydroxy-2-oxoglutarate aldolase